MFYDYRQNNSFGRWDFDRYAGISVHVIVEADDAQEANYRASRIGLYFDGAGDCPCCGRRWYDKDNWSDADLVPSIYGESIHDPNAALGAFRMGDEEPEGFIHYKDGRMEAFYVAGDWVDWRDGNPLRVVPWYNGEAAKVISGEVIPMLPIESAVRSTVPENYN